MALTAVVAVVVAVAAAEQIGCFPAVLALLAAVVAVTTQQRMWVSTNVLPL